MEGNEAFDKLNKEQVIHLIIWQMFEKHISLDELTKEIKVKQKEIITNVNEHLRNNMGKQSLNVDAPPSSEIGKGSQGSEGE